MQYKNVLPLSVAYFSFLLFWFYFPYFIRFDEE